MKENPKTHKAYPFRKKIYCPMCKKEVMADVLGYVDEKTEAGVQAICDNMHFLKGELTYDLHY